MKNLDIKIGKILIKHNANMVDINNTLNLLGIISDDRLEKLNKKRAMKVCRITTILEERYNKKNWATKALSFLRIFYMSYNRKDGCYVI